MTAGCIYNIQRYSTHDGPGIRTTVFMKGCNLRCQWCHNPESRSRRPTLEFNAELCLDCRRCAAVCAAGVHAFGETGHRIERAQCVGCGLCAEECFAGALTLAGISMDEGRVMREIETDIAYYRHSGGGVTFSGGECMLQIDFLAALCRRCREAGIHVAVDTAGCLPWSSFARIVPDVPLFLYDIKAIDAAAHRALTGADNALILENLEKLLAIGARVWVRVPCVPGANDMEMEGIARWLAGKDVERVELLAYHRLGGGKARLLGQSEGPEFRVPTDEEMKLLRTLFADYGLPAR